MAQRAEGILLNLIAFYFRHRPQPVPRKEHLLQTRIVAHRGAHNARDRLENTLPAFDAAAAAGVWGIELDVRWTHDGVPVVFHDADTRRLFGEKARIDTMTATVLKRRFPRIPTLGEVVARYGSHRHLMIEIKAAGRPDAPHQRQSLMQTLSGLAPGRDFHLMALEPWLLDRFDALPPAALIPIARMRVDHLSRQSVDKGWAGITGHLLPITRQTITRHHRRGQKIGTGFADSPRCLFREVSRGVDWIFTNRAIEMQNIVMDGDTGGRPD